MRVRIIASDKLLDRLGLFMHIAGITIFPFIIIREDLVDDEVLINHEMIHIQQQRELWVIPFYILYVWYYLKNRWCEYSTHDESYRNIPFEKEAYQNEHNQEYLDDRVKHSWRNYVS